MFILHRICDMENYNGLTEYKFLAHLQIVLSLFIIQIMQ